MMSVLVSLLLALRGSVRSRAVLQMEVLALRHQLHVLERSRPHRLRLTGADRLLWVWLSRVWTDWRAALVIVTPQTVLSWHRQGFRLFWTWKSRRRTGRPTVPADVRTLIRTMSEANPLWGAPRIHGELLKLGIFVGQSSVAKYMARHRHPPLQTWRTFLANHIEQIMAADFFIVPTATYRLLFVLVILAHEHRRVVQVAVTDHPTAAWTKQQLRDAFPWDEAPRYLIHDRDHAFDGMVDTAAAMEIHEVLTAPRSPWQNAYVERFIGSVRRECLARHRNRRSRATPRVDRLRRVLHAIAHASGPREGRTHAKVGCPAGCRTHRGDSTGGWPPPSLRTSRRVTQDSVAINARTAGKLCA
jgi:putative transposase